MEKIISWVLKPWGSWVVRLIIGFVSLFGTFCLLYLLTVVKNWLLTFILVICIYALIIVTSLIFMQFVLYEKNSRFLEMSFSSLDFWVQKNDIGNATNLVKSLSANTNIKQYFEKEYNKIREENKLKNKKFKVPQKYDLLVKSIPEIVAEIDKATVDSLKFLETYIDFEPKNKSIQEKVLDGVMSIAFVAGVLGSLKYGIDFLSVKETSDLGWKVVIGTAVLGSLVFIIGWNMYKKNTRERNARNFLLLVFKAIKEKEK